MSIDFDKLRKISSFYNNKTTDYIKEDIVNQAIYEFDMYQQYAPNTHTIYVNSDDSTPILATFQDVSDLEIRTDSKWMMTSLKHKINAGDIFTMNGRVWMCIYDKEKNTGVCYKVKVQPCNYAIKIPFFKDDGVTPFIYTADSITTTFLTDMKDFKMSFPQEVGTTFTQVQFNEWTSKIQRESRIWLYKSAFIVGGVDFTNIDFYTNKGFLKWTLRPANNNADKDDVELGICNYYDYFPKETTTVPTTNTSKIQWVTTGKMVLPNNSLKIEVTTNPLNTPINFTFVGESLRCTLTDITNNTCTLNTRSDIGIIYLKATFKNDPSTESVYRIVITDNIT